MSYSIRLGILRDISELIKLRIAFLEEVHIIASKEELENYKVILKKYFSKHMKEGSFLAWIAEDDNRNIIATSGLVIVTKPPQLWNTKGLEAYIMNMYTLPKWRRKGIGSALLEKLLEECKKRGINVITLHATPIGRTLYEKFGFKPNNHYMNLWWE